MNFSEQTQFNNFGGSYSQVSTINSIYQIQTNSEALDSVARLLICFTQRQSLPSTKSTDTSNYLLIGVMSQDFDRENQFSPKNMRKNINSLYYAIQNLFTTYQGIQNTELDKALNQLGAKSAYLNQIFIKWLDQNTPTNSNKYIEDQLPIKSKQEIGFSFDKFPIKNDRFQRVKNNIDLGRFKNRDMKEEQSENIFQKISQEYKPLENNAQALISRIFTYNDQVKLHNSFEQQRYRLKWKYMKQKEKYVSKGIHTSQNQKKDFQLYSGIIQDQAGRVKQLLRSFRNKFQER